MWYHKKKITVKIAIIWSFYDLFILKSVTTSQKEPRVNSRRTVTNRARYVFDDEDDDLDIDSDDSGAKKQSKGGSRKRQKNDDDSDFEPEKVKKGK